MPFGRVAIWRDGAARLSIYIYSQMTHQARSSRFLAMAPIAMVTALCGGVPSAVADAKPCRTPCLAVKAPPASAAEVPAARPAAAAPRPAPRPRSRPQAAAETAQNPPAPLELARKPPPSRRCTDINMRAAVGEPLSDEDMKILRSQC
jgi:hypothetical protein